MSAITTLNPKAESARQAQALSINISAARGLAEMLKTNLGPKGTMKMLVSGAGDIKITKDGNILLHEMQVQHPTASLIARAATAQDDITGDGTTSIVLIIGELLKQADLYISEGLHPRIVAEGFELAKKEALRVLDTLKIPITADRETLIQIARTSLRTKLSLENADILTDIAVDAILALNEPGVPTDLNMVEVMEMQHRTEADSRLGEEKFTFVEGCKNPKSVTVLLKGSTKYILNQLKDGLRDGLRSVTNAIEDGCVIPGGGAFEIVAHQALTQYKEQVKGRARLGVQAFAESLLIIPKAIAQNGGHDQQETIVKLQHEYATTKLPVGIDITTGEPMEPKSLGIFDNYRVKKQLIHSSTSIATNLILVDEILRAGLSSLRPGGQ
ncbi:unnamed protein product [Rotaria magnacalcarata]|uniref:T-complex protein 1 subunit zeta n=1 Tax=Rotaria magnacalcarata TaxID=392030 RepID=A0A8S2QRY2_9BILA|nr:unnamed protein product [Rotaria magnacalcarata]